MPEVQRCEPLKVDTMALDGWRRRARLLRREAYALYLAARDPRTPWYAKALAICVVGYLDDLLFVPAGIAVTLRLVPSHVLAESRERALVALERGALSRSLPARIATAAIVLSWLLALALVGLLIYRAVAG